jgi:hypothetical protein
MRQRLILCSIPLLALAACHAKVDIKDADGDDGSGNVHIAMGDAATGNGSVSIDAPGFKAEVSLPSINLGGHVDLDGIKLAPGTKVSGVNVDARDNGENGGDSGTVRMHFTNPQPPGPVLDHYARSAADAGYGAIARTGTSLSAKKDEKSFAVEISPDGSGSRGTITMTGKDED